MLKGISVQGVYNPKSAPARAGGSGGVPHAVGGAAGYSANAENVKAAVELGQQALGITAKEYQQRQMGLVDEALLGVDRAFELWKDDYMSERQGVLGINARQDFLLKWDELAGEAIKQFGHEDETSAEALKRRLMEHGLYAVKNGGAWEARQEAAWKQSQLAAQMAWFERHVDENPLDGEAIAAEAQNLVASWEAKNPGLDSGELRAKLSNVVSRKRLEALIADDDRLEEAEEILRGMNSSKGAPAAGSKSERALAAYNFGFVKNRDGKFAAYASRKDGLMAIGERVLKYSDSPKNGWNAKDIAGVIKIYAPESDGNNTREYAAQLAKFMGVRTDQQLNFKDPQVLAKFIEFMPRHEHGAFVQIGAEEALEAAQAVLAGQKPKAVGSIADSGRGQGGALLELGISTGERAKLERVIQARKQERAEKGELNVVQGWLVDSQGLDMAARVSDLYERLAQVEDVQARRRMERFGVEELKFAQDRQSSLDRAQASELVQAIKDNKYSPLEARGIILHADCSDEAKELARKMYFVRNLKANADNRKALDDGFMLIDYGYLQTREEREAYALEKQLTEQQTERLRGYGGYLEDVSRSDVLDAMFAAGYMKGTHGKMPENIYDLMKSMLDMGKKATKRDLQQAAAKLILQGKVQGRSMPFFEALNKGDGDDFIPEVSDWEKDAIDDALKKRGLPLTDHNRGVMKLHRMGMKSDVRFQTQKKDTRR